MRFNLIFILLLLLRYSWGKSRKVYYNVTDAEYDKMPTLFEIDNYDACMNLESTLYCFVTIQLSPEDEQHPSEIWNIIKEVITVNRTYRHDRLRHGVCIPKSCPKIPSNLYATGNGNDALRNGISAHYAEKYASSGLLGSVTKMHCTSNESFYEVDSLDILYAVVVGIWLLTIVISTIYVELTKDQSPKVDDQSKIEKFLTSFSIIRNWERLTDERKSSEVKALQVIQGVRVYNIFFVIMAHSFMIVGAAPIFNPKFFEGITLNVANMFFSNGHVIVQTTFVLSGWLLSYNLCVIFEERQIKPGHLLLVYVNRLIRLLPLMMIVVGFHATWLRHMGDGPVWDNIVGVDFRKCRKNWFAVLLFINNYYEPREICLLQSWSMAVDTQCFIVALAIMMLVLRNKQHANKIFVFFIAMGLAMTFAHFYYINPDIIYRIYPETFYTLFSEYDLWLDTYPATEIGLPSYVQGLMFGYYFHKFQKEDKKIVLGKFSLFLWHLVLWIIPNFIVFIAGYFYLDGVTYTSTQAILYQSLSRYVFGLSVGLLIFGMTMGIGEIMIRAVTLYPLQILAKVSFSIYIVHLFPIKAFNAVTRIPIYGTYSELIQRMISNIIVSVLLGTVMCLLFEMPISALQKLMMSSGAKKVNEDSKKKQ